MDFFFLLLEAFLISAVCFLTAHAASKHDELQKILTYLPILGFSYVNYYSYHFDVSRCLVEITADIHSWNLLFFLHTVLWGEEGRNKKGNCDYLNLSF